MPTGLVERGSSRLGNALVSACSAHTCPSVFEARTKACWSQREEVQWLTCSLAGNAPIALAPESMMTSSGCLRVEFSVLEMIHLASVAPGPIVYSPETVAKPFH